MSRDNSEYRAKNAIQHIALVTQVYFAPNKRHLKYTSFQTAYCIQHTQYTHTQNISNTIKFVDEKGLFVAVESIGL